MKFDKYFSKIKTNYLKDSLSNKEVQNQWIFIRQKIDESKNNRFVISSLFKQSFAIAIIIFMLILFGTGSMVAASRNSKPGDLLYPVKIFSDRVSKQFVDNKSNKIEVTDNFEKTDNTVSNPQKEQKNIQKEIPVKIEDKIHKPSDLPIDLPKPQENLIPEEIRGAVSDVKSKTENPNDTIGELFDNAIEEILGQ
jgi:hypothetical protein